MSLNRRGLLATGSALALAGLGLTGCNSSAGSTAAGSTPGASGGAEDGAFPVTVAHKHGSTTITREPQRIVCTGLKDQDDLLALGIVPVAATPWLELPKDGILGAWSAPLTRGRTITALPASDKIPFEKIAALNPDLVLGVYGGMSKEDYQKLSQLVLTVAQPAGVPDWGVSWQEEAKIISRAVGRSGQMAARIEAVEKMLAAVRTDHPGFVGASVAVATLYQGIYVYGAPDPRTRMLTDMGFVMPDDLQAAVGTKQFGANISEEKIELLDTDLLIWLMSAADTEAKSLAKNTLYTRMKVSTEGRALLIGGNTDLDNAFNFVTVLSLPFTLERLVPMITAAVDGNPKTTTDS